MKKIMLLTCLLGSFLATIAQPTAKPAILYGTISKQALLATPFDEWFVDNYNSYQPNATVVSSLKKIKTKDITVQVFLGTWCGDSKREVPRFMKLLDALSFPQQQVQVIALGGGDSLYKQSPTGEEAGRGIFRVPVFIFYRDGIEINRINEYPAYSLEKDMLSILGNGSYIPNYRSFETIKKWMADSTLADNNITARSLAWQLKPLVGGEHELNSLGYLLLKQGKQTEALRIFQVNAHLFPESANVASSLGEGYFKTGDTKNAVQHLEKALELNKDPKLVKEILKVLYETRGLKE